MTKVVALVACYNEADKISQTVRALKSLPSLEVVVVDDCSVDNSAKLAKQAGARVVKTPRNLGKGRALSFALSVIATPDVIGGKQSPDIIFFLDGDLGGSAKEVTKLLQPVLDDKADMSIAILLKPPVKGGFGLTKGLARLGIRHFTGRMMQAPLSGQRVLKRELLSKVILADGFGLEVSLTIDALRRGFRVIEVETEMEHTPSRRNLKGFSHRGKQFLDIAKMLIKKTVARSS